MTSPDLQTITRTVAAVRPDVEIWDVQVVKAENLIRVLIEHPEGVDADLCAEIASALSDLRDQAGLEVSSPGIERPLIHTTHYTRALGETVHLRLREPLRGTAISAGASRPPTTPRCGSSSTTASRSRCRGTTS